MAITQAISVIIPVYNRAILLQRALKSVVSQTHPAAEIIVVDDGSDDNCRETCAQFPEVRYLYQDNSGVSAARNRGITAAKNPWLAFLDSDDEWLPEKLATQCRAIANQPGMRICHTDEIWIRNGRRVNPMKKHRKYGGYIYQKCLPLCAMSPSSVLIHNSIFEELGNFDEDLPACEDYDLWLRICSQHPVLFVDQSLLKKYGGHSDQLSQKYWGMDRFRVYALEKMINNDQHSNRLSAEDRTATLETLLSKLAILANGAEKRGKKNEARRYRQKRDHYLVI